jgi:hypothetical protein
MESSDHNQVSEGGNVGVWKFPTRKFPFAAFGTRQPPSELFLVLGKLGVDQTSNF